MARKKSTRAQTEGVAAPLPAWLPRTIYIGVAVAIVAVLALHTFKASWVAVDTTSLGLLALLVILPLAPYITKLKAGGVEAEIGPREAQKLRREAADLPVAATASDQQDERGGVTVEELIERDPQLGLAKLRIDLEREIRPLYMQRASEPARRGISLGPMIRELVQRDALPRDVAAPLQDVVTLANRAVHGEYVSPDVASDIADVGLRIQGLLRKMNEEASGKVPPFS